MKKSDVLPPAKQSSKRLQELTAELRELEAKLRLGGGPDKIERQHKQGKLTARERIELLLDKDSYIQEIGLLVAYDQYDGGAPGGRCGYRCRSRPRPRSCSCRKRCDCESRIMVAGDDQEDPARAGNRDALARADYLSGRFGRRESSLSGRRVSRSVWRVANLLLQLAHAPISEDSADFGGDGTMHRRRRISAGAFGRHHHGRRHIVYGPGRRESRKRCDRSNDRQRNARRRARAQ